MTDSDFTKEKVYGYKFLTQNKVFQIPVLAKRVKTFRVIFESSQLTGTITNGCLSNTNQAKKSHFPNL